MVKVFKRSANIPKTKNKQNYQQFHTGERKAFVSQLPPNKSSFNKKELFSWEHYKVLKKLS